MALVDIRAQKQRRTPEQMVEHLKGFELDLKFSAGIWYFAPGGGRFHDRYIREMTIEERLEKAARLKDYGLQGLEAHYPSEINEGTLKLYQQLQRDTGIRLVTVVPNLFFEPQFEFGSLSSPIPKVRRAAIERTKRVLELNRDLDTDFALVWPGIDGYENPFGIDLVAARDRFADGLAEAMDSVPGVRVAEEPKPYEPRGRILYGTTPEGILLAQKVEERLRSGENRRILAEDHCLVGLNPEVGHVMMGYEDLPYALSLVMEYGRLVHTHWNSQPLGNYDQDLNVGVISPEQLEAALYVLKMYGYKGYFGIDINPERMPVEQALKNCMDALRAANDRINQLDHEKIIYSTCHPDQNRGWLEAYLIRVRACNPQKLNPLPNFQM
ncbi:MAG: xylose isomerase [Candidatus Latescibacterota bacterium]|nr:MAG: xylose isomerase [Candidatus Latescibacterota bacterium]